MRYTLARQIFDEIRDRRFRVATSIHTPANNCYFKAMELVKLLTTLGYELRGRLGEIDWKDTPLPADVLAHYPANAVDTHFYLEIFVDGQWKILDPTWNKPFALKHNLPWSQFGADNQSCFRITRLYDLEEQSSYAWGWLNDPATIEAYINRMLPFLTAVNKWMEEENSV